MQEPKILMEQPNSRGTLHALVEQDDRCAYFYIYPVDAFNHKYRPRACWLRNLQPAPVSKDINAMRDGRAPMLEAAFCAHPEGELPLQKELLSILWMEEEDGATVLYDGEPLGVIPGWSLYDDSPAVYAVACIGADDKSTVFPLGRPESNVQHARIIQAMDFRDGWNDMENPQWPAMQEQFIYSYEQTFGKLQQYFAIDGSRWPPMGMGKFLKDDIVYYLTMGTGIRPMPWVEYLYNDSATGFRRMELGLAVSLEHFSETEALSWAEVISGMADNPWRQISWFGEGHTISTTALPAPFDSFILSSALYNGSAIQMPKLYGDKINLYWASPITQKEREFATARPNGGYELLEKLIQRDISHIIKKRESTY